jgi:hypothetical protein
VHDDFTVVINKIIFGGVHRARGTYGWLFFWRSGVDPSTSTTTRSFGGVVQCGLDVGRVMVDKCREEAPSGAMVASLAGSTKFIWILLLETAQWFDSGDDFCSVYTRCLLRVY